MSLLLLLPVHKPIQHPACSCSAVHRLARHRLAAVAPSAVNSVKHGNRRCRTALPVSLPGESLCVRAEWTDVTSSTKPEVHNVLHCRQRRTEPRPRVTCNGKFQGVWTCGLWDIRVDRQTTDIYRLLTRLSQYFSPLWGEVSHIDGTRLLPVKNQHPICQYRCPQLPGGPTKTPKILKFWMNDKVIKIQLVRFFFHICRKFEFLSSQGSIATCLRLGE